MYKDIPIKTVINNGIEFIHEENELQTTKHMYINIPSNAIMSINSINTDIISFVFNNMRVTLFPNAEPHIMIYRN